VAHSLRVLFNTRYLWTGLDISCEQLDRPGSDKINTCPTMYGISVLRLFTAFVVRGYASNTWNKFWREQTYGYL